MESMSNRETETQSYGDTDVTKETEDVPPLAASVKTLQEAVQLSLKDGLTKDCLFKFARAVKAFEITHDRRLPPAELQSAFSLWWSAAKPLLPPDADHDEWRFDFEDTFAKTHAALGANSLEEAIRRADANPPPPQSARYNSSKLKRLVAVCYQLQLLQGNSPFFLGVRDAAKIGGAKGLPQASAWLAGLVRDGVLIEVEKGTRKRATRFRFDLPDSVPVVDTNTPAIERINHHVCDLHRQRHVRRHEKWRRHNPSRAVSPVGGLYEIILKPPNKAPVFLLFHLVHHQQAHLLLTFQKIEKPFQQKSVIFPQNVQRGRCARCWFRSSTRHGRRENQRLMPFQQNEDALGHA
jgi:hypothetical protein